MNKPIIIIGNGGHALVITEILIQNHRKILGYTAPEEEKNNFGLPYLGTDEVVLKYNSQEVDLAMGIGSIEPNNIRARIFKEFKEKGYHFTSCIHPKAIISDTATLSEGVQVMAGAIIQPFVQIHNNTIINTGASIDHECSIGENVHITPGAVLSGNVHIESNCHIGTGATVIQGIHIGANSMVAAGAVVVNNIGYNCKVMGVPAKEV